MENRYILTEEVEKEYTPIIKAFIENLDNMTKEDIEGLTKDEEFNLDLCGTKLAPYTLSKLMEKLGYSEVNTDTNEWQLDFWINMKNNNAKSDLTEKLCIMGCGMTFELRLVNIDFV